MHSTIPAPVNPPTNRSPSPSRYWHIPFSLRTKLLVAFALILIPSMILILIGDIRDFQETRAMVLSADQSTAGIVGTMVDANIDDAIAVGQTLARAPFVQKLDAATITPYLRQLAPSLIQFANVSVWDSRGNLVASMIPPEPGQPPLNIADRPYFQEVMAFNEPRTSEIIIGRIVHRPTSVAAVPIHNQVGAPIGVVVVSINLDYFRARLWTVPLTGNRVIVITDPTGRLAFMSNRWGIPQMPPDLSTTPLIRNAIRGLPATQDGSSFPLLSGAQTGTATVTPHYHWVVAVLQPTSVTEAMINRRIALDGGSFALALGLGLLAIYFLSRQIMGPIFALDRAAWAWSHGHLDTRVALDTGDELEALGRSLNTMANSLAQTLARLADTDRRLLRERNRLQAIFETSPVGILVLDQQGNVSMVNPTAEALFGQPLVEHLPQNQWAAHYHLFHPDGTPYKASELPSFQALSEGYETTGVEMVIRRPNAWQVHLLVNSAPIRQEEGTIVGSVTIFLDITPFAEEERLRSEFVESAAHEFRSPLTVIKGYAEVAMRDPSIKNTRISRELTMIVDAADRASQLANELLRAAQLHLPPLLLHRQIVNLSRLVEESVAKRKQQPGGDKYEFKVSTVPVEVEGDKALLSEALTDILEQAEAAMPKGGPIEVVVSAWDGMSSVRVTDHGPEIPADRIALLFQPFTVPNPAEPQTPRRPTLLLYLARRIIEESGGWIRAESTPEATTVSISLPRRFRPVSAAGPNGVSPIPAPSLPSPNEQTKSE